MESILIIEDDPSILEIVKDNFEYEGYTVKTASDGEKGLEYALNDRPRIRENELHMPIIMLTAKGQESDIILGLNLGADDYITKPFSIKELLARVNAFLRRQRLSESTIYEFGNCQLDLTRRQFKKDGIKVKLSPKEFKLLEFFVKRPGRALTRNEILNAVWGFDRFVTMRNIDRFVTTLRNKIEPEPHTPSYIHTIREIGYRFEPEDIS
ncbi:MAG: response regulator transcription factor [Planctomycetota bacterium]|jgi:DNA-binding response OmpR family regulator